MGNVQVRLPDDLEDDLDRLARDLHTTRSDAARGALAEGLRVIRMERAVGRYAAGEFSLERAAREAGVSLYRMARTTAERGIPYFRYSAEDAGADLRAAREILRDRRRARSS